MTVREAAPNPPPGPERDGLVAVNQLRVRAFEDAMTTALTEYLKRVGGVVRARVKGPKVRQGTKWWGPTASLAHTAPVPTGMEYKAVDAGAAVPERLVGEIEDAVRPVALRVARDAAADTARRLGYDVPDTLGDGLFAVDEQAVGDAVEAAIAEMLGAASRHAADLRKAVLDADATAETLDEMLDRIEQAHERGGKWLLLRGRDLAHALANRAALEQARSLGVRTAQWLCVTGDTEVWAPGALNVARRWNEEGLLRITTAQGAGTGGRLSVTPDHPVLTDRGWIPARELHVGDHLVRSSFVERNGRSDPDPQRVPTQIEKVFTAAHEVRPAQRMMRVAPHLDGDGSGGHVDVVPIDGELRDRLQAAFEQPGAKLLLTLSDLHLKSLLDQCPVDHLDVGLHPTDVEGREESSPTGGDVGRFPGYAIEPGSGLVPPRDAAPLHDPAHHRRLSTEASGHGPGGIPACVGGGDAVFVQNAGTPPCCRCGVELGAGLGSGPVPTGGLRCGEQGVCLPQSPTNGLGTDTAERAGDLGRCLAGLVASDEILDIEFDSTPCHVYDLQTSTGWFIANGVIVHNSRRDERVRPTHVQADGQVRELFEPYRVGRWNLLHPGDPTDLPESASEVAGCRCNILFARPDDDVREALRLISDRLDRAETALAAARRLLRRADGAPTVPVPSGLPAGFAGATAAALTTTEPVLGFRLLDAAVAAVPGQRLALPATIVLGLAAAQATTGTVPLTVAIPAGTTVVVVGGAVVLAQGAELEVLAAGPNGVEARPVAP